MKIAYVIPTLSLGGAEKQQINILNGIDINKFKVKLFVLKNKTQLLSQLKNKNIDVEVFAVESIFNVIELLKFTRSIQKYKPDIMHSQMYNANILVRLVKLLVLPKCKIINHFHGMSPWMTKPKLYLDKITSTIVDKFIVVSQKSFDIRLEREGYPKEKMELLPNSVDMYPSTKFNNHRTKSEKNFVIGVASRLHPLKNIKDTIYMVSELSKKGFDLKIIVAGDGSEKENLLQYASDLGLSDKVNLLGFVADMESFYDMIDILCTSSRMEDLPLSIIEAMMSGKPVLASNVGGIPGLIKDVPYTMLIDDFCDPIEINHIAEFLESLEMDKCQKSLVKYAMKNFNNRTYCSRLEQIYNDMLGIT